MTNLVTPTILDDRPIGKIEQAHFQFGAYANTLARIILSKSTETPLAIGVYGEWGSGKTSLMQIVKAELEESRNARRRGGLPPLIREGDPNAFRPCRTVWFDAWKYSRKEALWVSLIDEIRGEMAKDSKFFKRVKEKLSDPKRTKYNVPEAVASVGIQFVTGGLVSLDMEKFKQRSHFAENVAFYDEFQDFFDKIIADYTKRSRDGALVIFIDDLDRCLPSKVVQMLEAIKLFMDRPGCIFVLGADPKMVGAAIQAHYDAHGVKEMSAEEYLDKIVQVRFELPPLRADDVVSFVKNLPGLQSFTRDYLEVIVGSIRTNPRRIKTFINHIELQWSLLVSMGFSGLTNKQSLAEWLVLNEVCPAVREEAQSEKGEARIADLIRKMKQLADLPSGKRKKEAEFDKELGRFVDSETVIDVLKRGRFRFSEQEVGLYIHLSLAPSLISQNELKRQIDRVLDELTPREKRVLQFRFGLKDGHARTLKEIGEEFNVTGETIRLIEAKALRKLRHPSKSRKLEGFIKNLSETDIGEHDLLRALFGERES